MKLLNIKRSDYWDCELNKAVTIYFSLTLSQFEDIADDLRELGYALVKCDATVREFENSNHYVIVEME